MQQKPTSFLQCRDEKLPNCRWGICRFIDMRLDHPCGSPCLIQLHTPRSYVKKCFCIIQNPWQKWRVILKTWQQQMSKHVKIYSTSLKLGIKMNNLPKWYNGQENNWFGCWYIVSPHPSTWHWCCCPAVGCVYTSGEWSFDLGTNIKYVRVYLHACIMYAYMHTCLHAYTCKEFLKRCVNKLVASIFFLSCDKKCLFWLVATIHRLKQRLS